LHAQSRNGRKYTKKKSGLLHVLNRNDTFLVTDSRHFVTHSLTTQDTKKHWRESKSLHHRHCQNVGYFILSLDADIAGTAELLLWSGEQCGVCVCV